MSLLGVRTYFFQLSAPLYWDHNSLSGKAAIRRSGLRQLLHFGLRKALYNSFCSQCPPAALTEEILILPIPHLSFFSLLWLLLYWFLAYIAPPVFYNVCATVCTSFWFLLVQFFCLNFSSLSFLILFFLDCGFKKRIINISFLLGILVSKRNLY